jgi:hypothetical protein
VSHYFLFPPPPNPLRLNVRALFPPSHPTHGHGKQERDELRARAEDATRRHVEATQETARLRELSRRLATAHASLTGEHRMLRRAVAEV